MSRDNHSGVLNVRGVALSLIAEAKAYADFDHETLKEFVAAALEREVQWRKERRRGRSNTEAQRANA